MGSTRNTQQKRVMLLVNPGKLQNLLYCASHYRIDSVVSEADSTSTSHPPEPTNLMLP